MPDPMTSREASEMVALADRLAKVASVMRGARNRSENMNIWADDLKAVEDAEQALRRTAARPDAGYAVKALEWRDHRPDSFPEPAWSAQTPFGFYNIEEVSASDSPAYVVRLHAHHFIADKDSLDEAKAAAQTDYETRIRSAFVEQTESCLWALCYLHDWDAPKEGQKHYWEPGKNVFPEVHAFYRSRKDAEAVRCDMVDKDKYWVVRARSESEARLAKARSALLEQPATNATSISSPLVMKVRRRT